MKRFFILLVLSLNAFSIVLTQEGQFQSAPIVELFTDFHYKLNQSDSTRNGFGINRAYFGYNYVIDDLFSTTFIVDIGSPEDLAPGSKSRRYAHFREASLSYTGEKLNVALGITGTRIFMYQQKFWGKRYVAKPYQSINGYGFVADIGIVADYRFGEHLSGDFSVANGNGYSNLHSSDAVKASAGITFTPSPSLALRAYADIMKNDGIWQTTAVGFAGIKRELFYLGAEASFKSNLDLIKGHHAWGISGTGGISISEKTEFFARYDYSTSVVPAGNVINWNYKKDGSFVIAGLQYTANRYIKFALNYQSFFPYSSTGTISDMVYLNALVKF